MTLHLVTDRRRLGGAGDAAGDECLMRQARFAVDAALDVIQIRERDLEAGALARLVSAVVAIARGTRTRVVVNDRLDVALACGADGVHLRAESMEVAAVRRWVPAGFLVGRSVHTPEEARDAGPVDYLIAGTVFESASKPSGHRVLGVDGLRAVVAASGTPVLAIGGVTANTASMVAQAGAAGIAAIGAFMSDDPAVCRAVSLERRVSDLREAFDRGRSRS